MVFSMISSQSSSFTFVYSQPWGSTRTSGPISQKPWQPLFFRPTDSSWGSWASSTDTGMPRCSIMAFNLS